MGGIVCCDDNTLLQKMIMEEGYRHGAARHLIKPCRTADLRAKLDEMVGVGEV